MMEKNNYEPPIPDFPQPQHKFDNMIDENIMTIEEIIKTKEILQKVNDEGFDKVSDELMYNPDYLGERRATKKLLDKAAKAANKVLDWINKVKQEIDMNI